MSCVICQERMSVHDFPDHVRVFHPEDEKELLDAFVAPSVAAVA